VEQANGRQSGQWGGLRPQQWSQQRPDRNLVATRCPEHPPAGVELSPSSWEEGKKGGGPRVELCTTVSEHHDKAERRDQSPATLSPHG